MSAEGIVDKPRVDADFRDQLKGYSLVTAEILYWMPDHRNLLQSFVWQNYDHHPQFPRLRDFLSFWHNNLDGPLHRVRVAHQGLIGAREYRCLEGMLHLN